MRGQGPPILAHMRPAHGAPPGSCWALLPAVAAAADATLASMLDKMYASCQASTAENLQYRVDLAEQVGRHAGTQEMVMWTARTCTSSTGA